jgi:MFS family permease
MTLPTLAAGLRIPISTTPLRVFGSNRFEVVRLRTFRRLWLSGLANGIGGWLAFAAQGWLLLELTAPADRPQALIVFLALRMAPRLLLGLPAGALSDRYGALRMLRLARFGDAVPALLIGGAVVTGHLSAMTMFIASALTAAVNVFDRPAERTLVHRYAPGRLLVGGVALTAVTGTLAALAGPLLLMGIETAVGLPWAFLVLVLLAVASGWVLLGIDDVRTAPTAEPRPVGLDCWAAIRYVASAPVLLALMLLANSPGMLDRLLTMLTPAYAGGQGGDAGLTLLFLAPATGALLGGSLLAWLGGEVRRLLPLALGSSSIAVVSVGLLAITQMFLLSLVLFLILGAAKTAFSVAVMAALQRRVPDHARGRLLAL